MSLPGGLVERLEAALLDAFRDDDALDALLRRVGVHARVPSRAPLATRVGKLVEVVDADGSVLDLLDAARGLAPGNAALAQTQPLVVAGTATVAPPQAGRATRRLAPPAPVYLNADVQARAERLREAQARQTALRSAGLPTDEADREVLQRRRELREGGQLHAGDDLGGGRYLLIEKLGHGGFAVVWKAHDTAEQRMVAVKVLHANLAGDPQRRERFFRGARVMTNLAHPAVVEVLDHRGEDGGFCYFVMELVPGGNLREAVLQGRVAKPDVLPLIVQVGEALARAHASRVIHRDVKPSNIVLDDGGRAKLTDFDLVGAHDTTGGTRTGALGTVVYAAPECLDRPQDATARADVYGLGMTAIFALLGRELTLATFRNPAPTIARLDCSPRVRQVIERAVAWEAEQRFADAAALLAALRGALAVEPASVHGTLSVPRAETGHRPPLPRDSDDPGRPFAAIRFISGKYQGGEFPLRANRELIIGRSADLDIVLVEDMVSRRHAKLVSTDTHLYIEDTGSTNGTYVNGDQIRGRMLLRDGDRVLIGTSIFKIVPVGSRLSEQSEAEARRLLEAGAQHREAVPNWFMSGMIDVIPLPDLMRLLSTSRKTGMLKVNRDGSTGKIYLRDGAPYFAVINDDFAIAPQKSIHRILAWATGVFELENSVELEVIEELDDSIEALLMKTARERDELANLQQQLPPLDTPLAVPTPLASKLRELSPLELDTFQLVLDHGQLQKVLDYFPGTDVEAARHVTSLMKREYAVDPRSFTRSPDRPEPPETPEAMRALAIERLQQLAEFRRLKLPPLVAPLAVPTPLAGQLRELTASELDTFQGVLDHGQVRKVLSDAPDSALDMARNLVRLLQAEFVVVP